MPLIDVRCAACGAVTERLVRSASATPSCAACGSTQVERLLAMPARPARGGAPAPAAAPSLPSGGGCCGGGCHVH